MSLEMEHRQEKNTDIFRKNHSPLPHTWHRGAGVYRAPQHLNTVSLQPCQLHPRTRSRGNNSAVGGLLLGLEGAGSCSEKRGSPQKSCTVTEHRTHFPEMFKWTQWQRVGDCAWGNDVGPQGGVWSLGCCPQDSSMKQ